jgi:hypothetical protein
MTLISWIAYLSELLLEAKLLNKLTKRSND